MLISEIQRFCMHDGPGIRTIVFFQGCPLHCQWCHNPEMQSVNPRLLYDSKKCIFCRSCESCSFNAHIFSENQHMVDFLKCVSCGKCVQNCPTQSLVMSGKSYDEKEILQIVKRDCSFYTNNGGVTLSGGEPLLQSKEAISLLSACKEQKLHTAIETSGYFSKKILPEVVPLTDLFLWDIKDTNELRHKKYTGVSNFLIMSNLKKADELGARIRLRCILVNGVNTDFMHYQKIATIAKSLHSCEGVEFLPYHAFSGSKAVLCGLKNNGREDWVPKKEMLQAAKDYVCSCGIYVF